MGGPGGKGGQGPHGISFDVCVFCALGTFCPFKIQSQKGSGGGHAPSTALSRGCCPLPLAQPLTLLTPFREPTRRMQKGRHVTSAPLLPRTLPLVATSPPPPSDLSLKMTSAVSVPESGLPSAIFSKSADCLLMCRKRTRDISCSQTAYEGGVGGFLTLSEPPSPLRTEYDSIATFKHFFSQSCGTLFSNRPLMRMLIFE